MAQFSFNSEEVKSNKITVMPEGIYNVIIEDTELVPTKNNPKNFMLKLTMQVMDGDFANRKVYDRLNVHNDNEVAQNIAQGQLKDICDAVGIVAFDDTAELHGIPLAVKLAVKPPEGEYSASNDVKSYYSIDEGAEQAGVLQGVEPPVGSKAPAKPSPAKATTKKPVAPKPKPKPKPKPTPEPEPTVVDYEAIGNKIDEETATEEDVAVFDEAQEAAGVDDGDYESWEAVGTAINEIVNKPKPKAKVTKKKAKKAAPPKPAAEPETEGDNVAPWLKGKS